MRYPTLLDSKRWGTFIFAAIERIGLLLVLIATIVATVQEVQSMLHHGRVGVTDLLLLFIYLEIITMSGIYWRIGRLPVRMPLYIAMVALARHLTLDTTEFEPWSAMAQAGAILLLGLAVLVVRFGHIRLPYTDEGDDARISS